MTYKRDYHGTAPVNDDAIPYPPEWEPTCQHGEPVAGCPDTYPDDACDDCGQTGGDHDLDIEH